MAFWLGRAQEAAPNRLFPLAVGTISTVGGGLLPTGIVIDARKGVGVALLATFQPASPVTNGVARVAAVQHLSTLVRFGFDEVLPVCWMASVLYRDDIAPNQLTFPCSGVSEFRMNFPGELSIEHEEDAWQLPHYDERLYAVTVGFGLGLGIAGWAYSVPGQPGQKVTMGLGSYQLVRSNDDVRLGDPVPELEAWTLPLGFHYLLDFDQTGKGTLTTQSSSG